MKKFLSLVIPLLMLFSMKVHGQCAAANSVTTTISTTPNTCSGNGTITASFSNAANTTIQLIKGGTILQSVVNPTSPFTFTTLQPGTDYQVRTVCSIDNSIVYSNNSPVTVADNYVPISNADISVANVCTNFTPGGTITVNGVTGGTAPYQYKYVLSNNAAFPETAGTYSASNTFNATQFGTYQIRIKDACGGVKTFTETISPTVDPIRFYWRSKEICGSTQVQGSIWFATNNISGGNADESEFLPTGLQLVIRADNASGAILYNGVYTGAPFTYTPSASHHYYVTATNGCGASVSYTHDLATPDKNPEFLNFIPTASTAGCGGSATETLSINFEEQYFWKFPLSIVVKNSAGTIIHTTPTFNGVTWTLPGLPLDNYTITVSDSCSPAKSITKTINSPAAAGAPVLSLYDLSKWRCEGGAMVLNQEGTIQAVVSISGYFPDSNNAVVTITAGPSNVGVNATLVDSGQRWGWTNLTVGTYTVSYTSCGTTYTGTFTINNNTDVLNHSLTSTGVSTCNDGGTITSVRNYDGAYPYLVQLLNSAGTVIAENNTGNFTGVAAGTYTTRLFIQPCNRPSSNYYIAGSTVVITDQATGASISSAVGVICEDASGNPLTTGSAYLDLNGVAPFTLQYKPQGSSTWTTITNASANTVINGLTANTVYDLLLSDACGSFYPSTVQIKTMGNLSASNVSQPCPGLPYALTIPYYAGASYQWVNPQGTVVSNTRIYTFANYSSSYDGTYVCKINWSNCVTRFVNVTLNSNLCGNPINLCGTIDSDGDGVFDLCDLDDDNDGISDSNEQTCLSPISIGVNPNPTASETYGGTTATYTETSGSVDNISYGGYNGFNPTGFPSKLNISYSKNLINYSFRISDVDNQEKIRIYVYDKNGALITDISSYITYLGSNVKTSPGAGYSLLIEGINETGGTNNSFDPANYVDFKILSEVSRIEYDFYSRANTTATPEYYFLSGCVVKDTDNDGIPDYLDLDSDNDGCLDALEGGNNLPISVLVPAGGTVTVGLGSPASNQNLGNTVDANGVPTIVAGGQSAGTSANSTVKAAVCLFCYKPATTTGTALPTNHGITALGRAGSDNGNWPMVRTGAWTVLEAKTKGFVINRIATTAAVTAISNPVIGMMVYDAEADCLKINTDGTSSGWKCFNTQTCP
jgi:hypothetical protein